MRLALAQCDGMRWAIDLLADADPDTIGSEMPENDVLADYLAPGVQWLANVRPGILLIPIPEVLA